MERDLEFLILGPLEVRTEGRLLTLRTAKQRALLAILLLHANQVVSRDRLIYELWGARPPETATNTLHVYLSQLRKLLEPRRAGDRQERVLLRRPPGYMLAVRPDELDGARFERLVADGMLAVEDDPAAALEVLAEALALWRGPALAEFVFEDFARSEIARLEELRQSAIEARLEAELALGRHAGLVGRLEALIVEHPLRERLRGQLMLALYRSGRQAEALDAYQKTRQALVEELGIEPGPGLQQLERAILNQDPALDPPATPSQPPTGGAVASRSGSPTMVKGVRKPVTAVSLEVALARKAGGRIDPEIVLRALPRIHEAIARVLQSHGGTIQGVDGGEVTAVFGVPEVHEDDPLRAVRASADVRDAIEALIGGLEADFGVAAMVRAGVTTEEALTGPGLASALVGGVGSVAGRFRSVAAIGEILIGEGTRRLVRDATELEPSEPVAIALTGETVPVWRLVRVLAGVPGVRRRLETPMVGRAAELELLTQAFASVLRERRPHIVTVAGPAGIGKTRLARELVPLLAEEARILQGRCPAYGEGVSFLPVVEIVRQVVADALPFEGIRSTLGAENEAELISDRLGALIGITESPGEAETMSWAVRKFLEALARERPLVIVLDDLHWAEPTLLDLIDYVIDWAADAPILFVCLTRPELLADRPTWSGGRRQVSSLLLEPLTDDECETLIARLAGRDFDPGRRARIMAAARGNPLFLEQLLAMREEESGTETLLVPPTIQALLAARLDRLEPAQAELAEAASVIGEEFWRGALAELAQRESERALDAALHELIRQDLIEPCRSTIPGEDALRFRHVLIREAAYERLPKGDRADLHERFGDWLERHQDEQEGEYDEIIGYHLEQAFLYRTELGPADETARSLAGRAGSTLASAGMRARRRGDSRGSVGLLARAIALLTDDHGRRGELLLHLAEELLEVGDFHWADDVLAEADVLADSTSDELLRAHALVLRLHHQLQIDPHVSTDALVESVESTIDVLADRGDERGQARAWTVLSWIPWMRCQAGEAETALRRALDHARRAGDERTEIECLGYLLGTALFGPLPVDEGIRRAEAALEHPSKLLRTAALRALAVLRAMEGDQAEARRLVAENKKLLNDLGLRYAAASAATEHGSAEMLLGDLAAAERELREGYGVLEEMGETSGLSTVSALLAAALAAQGKAQEALRYAELSERIAAGVDLQTLIPARRARARALAALGQLEEAEAVARHAVELAQGTDWLNLHADACMSLAYVLLLASKVPEAAAAAKIALQLYEQKGNIVSAQRARTALRETFIPA